HPTCPGNWAAKTTTLSPPTSKIFTQCQLTLPVFLAYPCQLAWLMACRSAYNYWHLTSKKRASYRSPTNFNNTLIGTHKRQPDSEDDYNAMGNRDRAGNPRTARNKNENIFRERHLLWC